MASREILHTYPLIDEIFEARRNLFAEEGVYRGLRNHAFRMVNFARQWIDPSPERDDKLAVCAAFHDIGVFPSGTLDYLDPSSDAADAYLDETGRSAWKPEMRLMIQWHHKITSYQGDKKEWVEPVRRADWLDVSFSAVRFGLPGDFVSEVRKEFPVAAFYPFAVTKVIGSWVIRHPLNPLPVFKW
jgi:hypothetical protein